MLPSPSTRVRAVIDGNVILNSIILCSILIEQRVLGHTSEISIPCFAVTLRAAFPAPNAGTGMNLARKQLVHDPNSSKHGITITRHSWMVLEYCLILQEFHCQALGKISGEKYPRGRVRKTEILHLSQLYA